MRLTRYVIFLFLFSPTLKAQHSTIRFVHPAITIVKLAPLWMFDADPSVMGDVEV